MNITEFAPAAEVCTATMNSEMPSGESFGGPIAVGYYPGSQEVWIDHSGARINIQTHEVDLFCKQLKRAAKIAQESTNG